MTATIPVLTREAAQDLYRWAKTAHPYSAKTVQTGRWCYEVSLADDLDMASAFYEALRDKKAVLYIHEDVVIVATRRAAEAVCRVFGNRGIKIHRVRVGKATFGSRGFYDDSSYAFESAA